MSSIILPGSTESFSPDDPPSPLIPVTTSAIDASSLFLRYAFLLEQSLPDAYSDFKTVQDVFFAPIQPDALAALMYANRFVKQPGQMLVIVCCTGLTFETALEYKKLFPYAAILPWVPTAENFPFTATNQLFEYVTLWYTYFESRVSDLVLSALKRADRAMIWYPMKETDLLVTNPSLKAALSRSSLTCHLYGSGNLRDVYQSQRRDGKRLMNEAGWNMLNQVFGGHAVVYCGFMTLQKRPGMDTMNQTTMQNPDHFLHEFAQVLFSGVEEKQRDLRDSSETTQTKNDAARALNRVTARWNGYQVCKLFRRLAPLLFSGHTFNSFVPKHLADQWQACGVNWLEMSPDVVSKEVRQLAVDLIQCTNAAMLAHQPPVETLNRELGPRWVSQYIPAILQPSLQMPLGDVLVAHGLTLSPELVSVCFHDKVYWPNTTAPENSPGWMQLVEVEDKTLAPLKCQRAIFDEKTLEEMRRNLMTLITES